MSTALAVPNIAQACATCGCTLSSDAAMGYSSRPGWIVNLQYDYINQSQLRHGTHAIPPSQVVNEPSQPELEHQTVSRYYTLGLSYIPTPSWVLNLQVPYVVRTHSTYGDGLPQPYSPASLAGGLSESHSSSLGDMKLIASYQGFLPTRNFGVQLGVKLPTGESGDVVKFSSGPSAGQPLDASLQPGTGSTDLIVGAYYYQPVSQNFDAFANGQFQAAVLSRQTEPGNNFRPGNLATLSFGLRYEARPTWVPQLQVNLSHKSADQGALADTLDTAGTAAYLSPGITVSVPHVTNWHAYGFVQLPVYSNLDGNQLFPRWTTTVGLSHLF